MSAHLDSPESLITFPSLEAQQSLFLSLSLSDWPWTHYHPASDFWIAGITNMATNPVSINLLTFAMSSLVLPPVPAVRVPSQRFFDLFFHTAWPLLAMCGGRSKILSAGVGSHSRLLTACWGASPDPTSVNFHSLVASFLLLPAPGFSEILWLKWIASQLSLLLFQNITSGINQ